MPEKTEALGILLLLVPGFVCALLVQLLAVRAKQTEFEKVVEALLFSSILYLCIGPFFHNTLPARWVAHKAGDTVWNDALQDIQSRYLLVELGDQRTVVGYLRYYSNDVKQASIFLQDAAWLRADGVQVPIDGPGILLTKEAGIVDPVVTDAIS